MRLITASFVLGLALVSSSYPLPAQSNAQDSMAKAYRALRAGSHGEALAAAEAAVSSQPESPEALTVRGMILVEMGRAPSGLIDLNRAIDLDPSYVQARLVRGWAFVRDQLNNPAMADFEIVLSAIPDHPSALTGRALAALQKGEFASAVRDADKALGGPREFTPEDAARAAARLQEADLLTVIRETWAHDDWDSIRPLAFFIRGQARIALDQRDIGFVDLEEAIRLNPKELSFRLQRAQLLAQSYRYSEAFADCRAASQIAPDNATVHALAASAALAIADTSAAVEHAAAAARLQPGNNEVLTQVAYVYLKTGDIARAIELFEKPANAKPPHLPALTGLILARLANHETQGLAELIARAEVGNMARDEILYLRGQLLRSQGDSSGAMAALREALKVNPRHTEARRARSQIRQERRDVMGADRELELAIQEDPRSVDLLLERAWLQFEYIDDNLALDLAGQARKIAPDHPKVLHFDSLRALEAADWAGAIDLLDRLLITGALSEPHVRMLRATAHLESGGIPAAQADLAWIQEHDASDGFAAVLQTCCHLATGNTEAAIKILQEELRENDAGWLRLELALCQWRAGHAAQAVETLEHASGEQHPLALAWALQIRGFGTNEGARAALSTDERLALLRADQYLLHYERGVVLGANLRNPYAGMFKPGRREREADEPVAHALLLSAVRAIDAGDIKQARRYLDACVKFSSATKIARHLAAQWLTELPVLP